MRIKESNWGQPVLTKIANLFCGDEAVGGKMYLSKDGIAFSPHNFNVQSGDTVIPLCEIAGVEKCNTLGIVPNGLRILTRTGEVFQFVLWGRDDVMTCLESLMGEGRESVPDRANASTDVSDGQTPEPSLVTLVHQNGESVRKQDGQIPKKSRGMLPYVIGGIVVILFMVLRGGCSSTFATPEAAVNDFLQQCCTSGQDKIIRDFKVMAKSRRSDGHSVSMMFSFRFDGRRYAGGGSSIYASCIVRENDGDWDDIEFLSSSSGLGKRWTKNFIGWWSESD